MIINPIPLFFLAFLYLVGYLLGGGNQTGLVFLAGGLAVVLIVNLFPSRR